MKLSQTDQFAQNNLSSYFNIIILRHKMLFPRLSLSLSLFACPSVFLCLSLSLFFCLSFFCVSVCLSVCLSLIAPVCGIYNLHFCTVIMYVLVFPKCLISSLLVTYIFTKIRPKNKIPVFPLTRPTRFFVPTLQFLLPSRKNKNKFIPTDPKMFQKIGQKALKLSELLN